MPDTTTFAYYKTAQHYLTVTSGSDAVIDGQLFDNIASTAANTIIEWGRVSEKLGATAADTKNIWPGGVAALTSGTAIHFVLKLTAGSTDTTAAARKVSFTSGDAKVSALFAYAGQVTNLGRSLELDFTSVTTLVCERINTANEKIIVEGFWFVYTI
jgi:hypothetical protein